VPSVEGGTKNKKISLSTPEAGNKCEE